VADTVPDRPSLPVTVRVRGDRQPEGARREFTGVNLRSPSVQPVLSSTGVAAGDHEIEKEVLAPAKQLEKRVEHGWRHLTVRRGAVDRCTVVEGSDQLYLAGQTIQRCCCYSRRMAV
jgi:hypothetical protein